MNRQILSVEPMEMGSSLFISPHPVGSNTQIEILSSYNASLLSSTTPTLKKIKDHIQAADDDQIQAENKLSSIYPKLIEMNDMIYLEAKLYLHRAQEKLLKAQSWLLSRITQKQHMLHEQHLQTQEDLPEDIEFKLFENTLQSMDIINHQLIEITLEIIESYIKRGLVYHTDQFFDELKSWENTSPYQQQIENLRKIAINMKSKSA